MAEPCGLGKSRRSASEQPPQGVRILCPCCSLYGEITAFGSYLHYISVKNSLDTDVKDGYIKILKKDNFGTVYECEECGEKWLFIPPDFPSAGRFISSEAAM